MSDSQVNRPCAVVTGSSSGIGAAIARRLAANHYDVIVHGASNASGAREIAEIAAKNNDVEARVELCDFRDSGALENFVSRCFGWKSRIDVWVNNAGADVLTGDMAKASFGEKLRRLLDIDVVASLLLSRMAAERMTAQTPRQGYETAGLIVNIGWDQAEQGMAGESGQLFAASKGAVMAATRSLAQSFAPTVRVNCVAPGWIRTAWGQSAPEFWHARATHDSLLGRWGEPEDVAAVVAWLAEPETQFVNGQVIAVNGGFRYGEPV
jgi:3-oxoacyl-[acyl-carrier protein] reductase